MPVTRQDELPEYVYAGPFGGIQSEVGLSQIETTGFVEAQNLLFRKSKAEVVPGFTQLSASPSGEPIMGMADFFNVRGTRIPVIWTPTKMYYWSGGAWTQVTGTLTGANTQFFQSAVVGYKLYFSQQQDVVQVWDGITPGFSAASASAVAVKYLCELDFHLIAANGVLAGPTYIPNRVYWSGSDDGTDWTSWNSGQDDLFNSFGPINGLTRLFQYGYAFQQWGITQIIPTGNGLVPFDFVPMGAVAKGNILPYSLASFGEMIAAYVGKDDIYVFDGTSSQGIGSRPIDGNRRLGARKRIFQDLFYAVQADVFGFILTSANGMDYESYWLLIPSLNKAWVYHFDEGNWTQVFFNTGQLKGPIGTFPTASNVPAIQSLQGTIQEQSWTPSQLNNATELDTMALSDAKSNSLAYLDPGAACTSPTSGSINATDEFYLKSGQLTFGDTRHSHTVKKFRVVIEDIDTVTLYLRLTNDKGYSVTKSVTLGTGSGNTLSHVFEASINGKFITWELSGNSPAVLVEFAPVYDTSGELRGGTA